MTDFRNSYTMYTIKSSKTLNCIGRPVLLLLQWGVLVRPLLILYVYVDRFAEKFMADAASQAGDNDSFPTPGLASGFYGSINVHCDIRYCLDHNQLTIAVHQCISFSVFSIMHLFATKKKKNSDFDWNNNAHSRRKINHIADVSRIQVHNDVVYPVL